MEEIMSKQKTCEEYAYEMNWNYSTALKWSHDHKYSPRFDRCFSLRNFYDKEDLYVILDVLSREVLLSGYHEGCIERLKPDANNLKDSCPDHWDVLNTWELLTKQ